MKALLGVVAALLVATVPLAGGAADPFEINAIVPLTGSFSFIGQAEAGTLKVVEGIANRSGGINGRPIKFVIEDDASDPKTGVQLFNAVLAKNVAVVLGSTLVSTCNAFAALAKEGPVVYCFSPGVHPAEGSYMFSGYLSTADLLAASSHYFRGRGWRRIAIITSNDATGQDAERGIDEAFNPANGETIVDRERFNVSDLSVAAQIAHVKASGAQALITWSNGTPMATILRDIVAAGLDLPVEASGGNATYAQMKAYASFIPKDLYFAFSSAMTPGQLPAGPAKTAVQQYQAAFAAAGTPTDNATGLAWDPAWLVIDAYRKLGTAATAEQIRAFIAGQRDWIGINGRYDFRAVPQRGVGANNVMVARWDAAKNTWIGVSKPGGEPAD
jgi:branched-chain amino acid transport system substrate-binding protein